MKRLTRSWQWMDHHVPLDWDSNVQSEVLLDLHVNGWLNWAKCWNFQLSTCTSFIHMPHQGLSQDLSCPSFWRVTSVFCGLARNNMMPVKIEVVEVKISPFFYFFFLKKRGWWWKLTIAWNGTLLNNGTLVNYGPQQPFPNGKNMAYQKSPKIHESLLSASTVRLVTV